MPENGWADALWLTAEEVLEKMFFACVCGPAPDAECSAEPCLIAHVAFQGRPCGALTVSISRPAALTLAANFLAVGDDESPSDAQVAAVVCELTNMICGCLLTKVESDDCFRLSAPAVLQHEPDRRVPELRQSLDLGDGILSLALALEAHA